MEGGALLEPGYQQEAAPEPQHPAPQNDGYGEPIQPSDCLSIQPGTSDEWCVTTCARVPRAPGEKVSPDTIVLTNPNPHPNRTRTPYSET